MKPEQLLPQNSRILIKELDEVEEYGGLIALAPQASKEASNIAEVIKLPEKFDEGYNNTVKVGNKVIFNRHSGAMLNFDRYDKHAPTYRLIKPDDILAVIQDDN